MATHESLTTCSRAISKKSVVFQSQFFCPLWIMHNHYCVHSANSHFFCGDGRGPGYENKASMSTFNCRYCICQSNVHGFQCVGTKYTTFSLGGRSLSLRTLTATRLCHNLSHSFMNFTQFSPASSAHFSNASSGAPSR